MNDECIFEKTGPAFWEGIGYDSAQQLTNFCTFLVRIHDLKLMLEDSLA